MQLLSNMQITHCHSLIIFMLTVRERDSAGTDAGGKRSRLRALSALNRPPTQKTLTRNKFNSSRQRGKESLSPCHNPHLFTWRDFPAPSVGALCERWALCGSSTLPPYRSPGRGRPMTWGTSPSVLSWSSTRCSRPISCLGAGQDGKWRTGGRRLGPAGKSKSSLERGLWGCAGADRNGHIPGKKWNPSR